MALATFVKINSVNNLSDARYCAGMEVDQLGFVIEEGQENYVSPKDFNELAGWISGVCFVGEVVSESANLSELAADYQLDAIQVMYPSQIEKALSTGLKTIFSTDDLLTAEQALNHYPAIDYVLWQNDEGASLHQLKQAKRLVISAGFNAENVKELTNKTHVKGIAMQGGDEIRPGFKNFDELADILEALDTDEYV